MRLTRDAGFRQPRSTSMPPRWHSGSACPTVGRVRLIQFSRTSQTSVHPSLVFWGSLGNEKGSLALHEASFHGGKAGAGEENRAAHRESRPRQQCRGFYVYCHANQSSCRFCPQPKFWSNRMMFTTNWVVEMLRVETAKTSGAMGSAARAVTMTWGVLAKVEGNITVNCISAMAVLVAPTVAVPA